MSICNNYFGDVREAGGVVDANGNGSNGEDGENK